MNSLAIACQAREQDMLRMVQEMVNIDSPSSDPVAMEKVADLIVSWFSRLDVAIVRHEHEVYGPTLEITAGTGRDAVLMVGHMDTVWPIGETKERPFTIKGKKAFGPGVCDMKAGIAMAWLAMAAIIDCGLEEDRKVVLIVNPDEEIGSPSSRDLISRIGTESRAALILEPAGPDGAVKTQRKGVFRFTIRTKGKSAHGSDPKRGINAIVELAHHVAAIGELDYGDELTVNVGKISGGDRVNVVPPEAEALLDVRAVSMEAAERFRSWLDSRESIVGGEIEVEFRSHHPPFERTPANRQAMERARAIAAEIGVELQESAVGGASDGNYLSASGVATIDGLGPIGGGAHALSEYVMVGDLAPRSVLIAALARAL